MPKNCQFLAYFGAGLIAPIFFYNTFLQCLLFSLLFYFYFIKSKKYITALLLGNTPKMATLTGWDQECIRPPPEPKAHFYSVAYRPLFFSARGLPCFSHLFIEFY